MFKIPRHSVPSRALTPRVIPLVLPGAGLPSLPSVSSLSTLHSHESLGNWLGDRIDCPGIAGPVFKSPLCDFVTAPKRESTEASHADVPQRPRKASVCRTHNVRGHRSHPQFRAFTGGPGPQPPTDEGGLLTPYLHMYCGKSLPYLGIILFLNRQGFFLVTGFYFFRRLTKRCFMRQ